MYKPKYLEPRPRTGSDTVLHLKPWAGLTSAAKLFDYSLNGHIGTVTGTSPTFQYPGIDFPGTDEYVDTGDTFQSTFQDSFSISAWIKPTDGQPPSAGFIVGVATTLEEDCVWMVLNTTGSFTFQYSSNGNRGRLFVNGGNPLLSNGQETWHHLVMVVDSTIRAIGGVKAYFDSVLQPLGALSKGDTTNVVSADFRSTINLIIGAEDFVGTVQNFYDGLIDDVMIFSKALSAAESKNIYEVTRRRYGV